MKNTLKKALSIVLCFCLMSFVLAFGSAAYNGFMLILGKTVVTEENMDDIFGDGTAKFVPGKNSGTLYLDNASIEGEGTAIYCDVPLTIELSGKNTVKANGEGALIGISADDDVTVTGDGELSVELGKNLGDFDSCVSYGINAFGDFTIESGKVSVSVADATGINGEDAVIGCVLCNNLYLNGGELVANAGDAVAQARSSAVTRGVVAIDKIAVDGGTLTASCGKTKGNVEWLSSAVASLNEDGDWLVLSGDEEVVSPKAYSYGEYALLDENGDPVTFVKIAEKTYTVFFDTDGGSTVEAKQVKKTDAVLAGVEAPVKEGFKFIGWVCGEKEVAEDDTFASLADGESEITLTATWEEEVPANEQSEFAQFMTVLAMLLRLVFKFVMMVTK